MDFSVYSKHIIIGFCLILFCLFTIFMFPFTNIKIPYGILSQINNTELNNNNACKRSDTFQPDAPVSDFDMQINEKLQNCLRPETDSQLLNNILDFVGRQKWATYYRRGCWAPTFSKIDKVNNTLIIDCPPSMEPKYGFGRRTSVDTNYTGPVNIGEHEWIYTKCKLPFYSQPTTRLHFHAQPLPQNSSIVNQKPNVVFMQFDALGRQAMYRRMPLSYKLLTSYDTKNSSSTKLTKLRDVEAIEFRHLNVNGYNSEPNMRLLYCGSGNCQTTSLLRLYKQAGFSTSLLESYSYQLGNYVPSNAVDRILASNYFGEFGGDTVELYSKRSGCVTGTTWIADEMFDYLQDRFLTMRSGGWFSINNMVDPHSEDELNNYAIMDLKFHEFLLRLSKSESLDNTIIIILGDHGLHGRVWKELWREFDHRNPYLQILIGKNVTGSADIIKNLKANSDKLVTHADLYMTFARFSNTSLPLILPHGINLFEEKIPESRTCRTAKVPDKWCNCWLPKSRSKSEQ